MTDTPAAPTTAVAVPDHIKKLMQQSGDARADAQSLAAASISIPRISLKGRKFRLIEGGEEIRKPTDELDCVVLGVEPGQGLFVKTYYEGQYQSGDSSPPTCASSDGVKPDAWVTTPQSARCAGCPKNIFGSATSKATGKKSKACRDSKRVWVALPENVKGTVYALNIPVTSLKNVSEYGRELEKHGFPLALVVTRITMEDMEYPVLKFERKGFLSEQEGGVALERKIARDWHIGSNVPILTHEPAEPAAPAKVPSAAEVAASVTAPPAAATPAPTESVLKNW